MGLLSSILNLAIVVGAGWFTIYYLIPKIESGELGLPAGQSKDVPSTVDDEPAQIEGDIAGAVTGEEEPPPVEEKKKKKAPYDPKKGMAGKGESKKKKSKKEFRIIEYLAGDYGYGIY